MAITELDDQTLEVLRDRDSHELIPALPEVEGAKEADPVTIFYPPVLLVNTFAQHRKGRNERQADLNASVEADGGHLLYPVDMAIMSESTALQILDFTNRVWGGTKNMDDLEPFTPGLYLVLIAGHSRKEAVEAYATKHKQSLSQTPIKSQLHQIEGVDDFLALQLKENIHSAPPPERAARGYAEAFLWAKVDDPKLTRAAFCREHGIRGKDLREALLYADLPPYIRDMQDAGSIPWSITMELAKAMPLIVKEAEATMLSEGDISEQNIMTANQHVKDTLLWLASLFTGKYKGRIRPTQSYIRNHVNVLKQKYDSKPQKDESGDFAMTLFDAHEVIDSRAELHKSLGELATERALKVRTLHNQVAKVAGFEELGIDTDLEDQVIDIGRDVEEAASTALRRLVRMSD